jgi:F-type H+-transporting ATPase subunit alpha
MNLLHQKIIAPVFGQYSSIKVGDMCFNQKELPSVCASYKILGRIVNAFGNVVFPLTNFDILRSSYEKMQVDVKGPSIITRFKVNENLLTGIKIIDGLVPVGRGQRELIIGDRQTGKTSIILDTILNQKFEAELSGRPVFCIYVNIGQRASHVSRFYYILEKANALSTTLIVSAAAAESVVEQYLAPFSATAFGEFFMYRGHDVLLAYDDLSKHAVAYRQLSLLLRRAPGREAYPGDVFYLHSRLLERSANMLCYGSITALPVIETLGGDVSAYIPTNVISITDGQIFLDTGLFYQGVLPAINIGLSVSRVGAAAQYSLLKKVAGSLKLDLALFREIEGFASFSSNLDEETTLTLKKGQTLVEILKQDRFECISLQDQIVTVFFVINNFLIYIHFL